MVSENRASSHTALEQALEADAHKTIGTNASTYLKYFRCLINTTIAEYSQR
jgi:hypothetical protein